MAETEKNLVSRCQAGDRAAFGALVKQHAGRAIGAASLMLGSRDDAMDASQDAFVRAWRGIRRFRSAASFYTWYSTILRNVCLSRLRRRRERQCPGDIEDHLAPSLDRDPAVLAERDEQSRRLWTAIRRLPAHYKDIILMNHFQDMSYRQMAELLDVPIGTVMSRLHNARKALRKALAED